MIPVNDKDLMLQYCFIMPVINFYFIDASFFIAKLFLHEKLSLQNKAQTTKTESERLLATSEQTGRLLSTILDVDTNETVNTTLIGSRNNIG